MGLFKRLCGEQGDGSNLNSIVENLNSILNTKRGYGSFLDDYGISDFSHYTAREQIAHAVMDQVKSTIEDYEPRVTIAEMSQMPDSGPFRLCFRMNCVIRDNSQSLEVVFDSLWNNFSIGRSE